MTFLYSCRTSGPSFRITKFTSDFEVESSYLCTHSTCECPAGHRKTCRHREMLPKFIHRSHVDDGWFFDYDRGGWVQGPEHNVEHITPTQLNFTFSEEDCPGHIAAPSYIKICVRCGVNIDSLRPDESLSIFTNGNEVVTDTAPLLQPEPISILGLPQHNNVPYRKVESLPTPTIRRRV